MMTNVVALYGFLRAGIVGVVLVIGMMVVGAYAPTTYAHGDYERSLPAADAVIPVSPAEVEVWFTQELFRREGANYLEVIAPDGSQVDLGDSQIDDDDRTHLRVSIAPDLPSGRYTVRWVNLSLDDGHPEEGEFSFTVDPSAPTTVPAESTAITATAVPSPTLAPSSPNEPLPTPTDTTTPAMTGCFGGLILLPFMVGTIGLVRRSRKGMRL